MITIKKDEPLSKHTTFKVGGPARYFCIVKTLDDLRKAIKYAKIKKLKVFILGAGSNILVSDLGFDGLVINFKGAAGVKLQQFLNYCADKGLSGLEFLAGIPGTIGGAIYMNAGAYGKTISEFIDCVYAVNYNGKQHELNRKQCEFGYRKSVFQKKKLIITGAEFDLNKERSSVIKNAMKAIIKRRIKKQPYNMPSAGSFFKNPKGDHAARLIEAAGLKGLKVGGAMVSKKHANFIVNTGKARAEEVKKLMKIIKNRVREKFKISLVPEVKIVE